MKYDVIGSCGHKYTVQLFGKNSNREYWLERLTGEPCDECKKVAQEQARAKENEEAANWAVENNMPALKGTEKQVAWAETLRRSLYKYMQALGEKVKPDFKEIYENFLSDTFSNQEAKWYIEHREWCDDKYPDLSKHNIKEAFFMYKSQNSN